MKTDATPKLIHITSLDNKLYALDESGKIFRYELDGAANMNQRVQDRRHWVEIPGPHATAS